MWQPFCKACNLFIWGDLCKAIFIFHFHQPWGGVSERMRRRGGGKTREKLAQMFPLPDWGLNFGSLACQTKSGTRHVCTYLNSSLYCQAVLAVACHTHDSHVHAMLLRSLLSLWLILRHWIQLGDRLACCILIFSSVQVNRNHRLEKFGAFIIFEQKHWIFCLFCPPPWTFLRGHVVSPWNLLIIWKHGF